MANPNAPSGFRPWKHGGGGTPGRLSTYTLSTAYNTALYQGDAVKTDGAGNLNPIAAGNQGRGIFWGVKFIAADGSPKFQRNWVASTAELSGSKIEALVYDDPDQLFVVQSVSSMTAADIGQWVDVDTSTAGNATTGISGQQASADGSTESTFMVVDVVSAWKYGLPCRNAAGNPDFYDEGANALVIVKFAKHELRGVASTEV
jgi:hypothetical protein